jgi:hypothetical protein
MSNPGVVKLRRGIVGNRKVWLDDNFGESIHIHIDDFRMDLTTEEFHLLHDDLCSTINEMLQIDNFDISTIDPVYLSLWFWPVLPRISRVVIDTIKLDDIICRHRGTNKVTRLSQSVGVHALQGLSDDNEKYARLSALHIGQTEKERLLSALESIKKNGYPYQGQYIILHCDDNYIRDGQHRASCLYHLYGNIEVPVMRVYWEGYVPVNTGRFYNSGPAIFYRKQKRVICKYAHYIITPIKILLSVAKRRLSRIILKYKLMCHSKENGYIELLKSR